MFSSSDSKLFSCFAVSFSTEILLSKSDFAFESSLCARSISDLICSALSAQAFAAFKSSSTDEYFISALRLSVSSFAELYLLFASAFLRINSVLTRSSFLSFSSNLEISALQTSRCSLTFSRSEASVSRAFNCFFCSDKSCEIISAESVSTSTSSAFANSATFVLADSDSVSSLVTSFDFL